MKVNRPISESTVSTAVILAAGFGSRLSEDEPEPKPLVPVVGFPVIARVMAGAAKAGIRHFVVVTGFQADRLEKEIPDLIPEGCSLELLENKRYEEPNGVSLLVASERLNEPFALLMTDHIFSPDRLRQAVFRFKESSRNLLVVEDRMRFNGDTDDATRVAVSNGRISNIGKQLTPFDAVDTGMFILWPEEITGALKSAGSSPSVSDGMRILSEAGKLDALDVQVGFWQDIDTPEDLQAAEFKLFESLRKKSDGILARTLNRRISLFLSKRLWRFGISPNWVTTLTLILGILAGWAFAQGNGARWGLLGATLFQLHSIIDGVDGELARLMHQESRFGFWYDISVDNLSHMAVFGGIAWGQQADQIPGPWGVLGWLAVLGVAACFAVMAPLLNPIHQMNTDDREKNSLEKLVDGLSRRDFTYLLFPLVLLGWLGEFLWAAAIGTWIYAATAVFLRLKTK